MPFSCSLVFITCHAQAQFTDLWIFGDSFSDQDNVLAATGAIPFSPPYFEGRFSDGPVWISHLADGLGLPNPVASLNGGQNFAVGEAQTGPGESTLGPVPNVGSQIATFKQSGRTVLPTELVVVWAGYNDLNGTLNQMFLVRILKWHSCT